VKASDVIMDENTGKILLAFATGNFVFLLGLAVKLWNWAKKMSIVEYQHIMMWKEFERMHFPHKERGGQE
jgi:hypothetical protein